jgi:hypothetical protein
MARPWRLTPVILATQEAESGESKFKASLGKYFLRPYFKKYPTQKRACGVAQMVQRLPHKCKALSSSPGKAKKRKEKKPKE